jgi:plastocyanin
MKTIRHLVVAAVVGLLGGCDGDPTGGNEADLGSLNVTASASTIFSTAPGNTATLTVTALRQNGLPLNDAGTPSFSSDADGIASVDASGLVTGVAAGLARISASLTVGGVTRSSAIEITVTDGAAFVTVRGEGPVFTPLLANIAQGGTVHWQFGAIAHTVVFTTAGSPQDMPEPWSGGTQSRDFTTKGTFDYHCTIHAGMVGQVRVR